ncbi:hypothetical protein EMCRGX_G032555 [Ephydatia muelleri]
MPGCCGHMVPQSGTYRQGQQKPLHPQIHCPCHNSEKEATLDSPLHCKQLGMITTPVRAYVTPTQTLKHYLGVRTLRLHKSTCAFVSGRLFVPMRKEGEKVVGIKLSEIWRLCVKMV